MTVTFVVRSGRGKTEIFVLGDLNADSDSRPPGAHTCPSPKVERTKSRLVCGETPLYNAYEASLKGQVLVVTRIVWVDGDPTATATSS